MHGRPSTGPLVMTATLTARSEKRGELNQTLSSLLDGIRKQEGCRECLVSQALAEEPRFHLRLAWSDRASLTAFLNSEVFSILVGAMNVLAEPVDFQVVSETDGLPLSQWGRGRPGSNSAPPQPPPARA
jgi:quinol monooxygenase YgiN